MTSNYKLSGHAYSTEFDNQRNITENYYDLTHDQVHTLQKAVKDNINDDGGFGWICLHTPGGNDKPTSNFPTTDKPVECRPAFISKDLVARNAKKQAVNAKTFNGQKYYAFAPAVGNPATIKAGVDGFVGTNQLNIDNP
tara:strand:- start:201 stop:617 length:417 start_codon:yes stop_codon:yes gene_type:complete